MSSNQSSYRPSLAPKYGGWREREAAKQRAREESERLRKEAEAKARLVVTETNFPTLSTGAARSTIPAFSTSFADLAEEWKVKDEIAEVREQNRQQREQRERMLNNGIYVMSRANYLPETPGPLPFIEEPKKKGPAMDADGFEIVEKRKQKKVKRELTEAELHRKYAEAGSDEDQDDRTQNEHLFESNRHDHY
jgi:hypothetical protein